MKLHSDIEEAVIYYERNEHIYKLVRCKKESGSDFYVVRDKKNNPLLASIEREPAMTFFLYKCNSAEQKDPLEE